ncbi:MAG: Unknown protein [uncultured Sulfurovum sp.]|uniref:Uncharacterized protein n=1 Tax=uncultured Sulfurovum sp. TaxID=269237 RepID=A0A6S6SGA4_9BACT|nr:MAG: Unknown protein [uncultured Sulfurovum sp.]
MANLKGGSYEKQIKDAFHRLEAFGKSRHGKSDHMTHSDGIATKREMYLQDYKNFSEQNGFSEKLNKTMTNDNIQSFLNQRLEGLKTSTQENYTRGFSSMLEGLKEANIAVSVNKSIFDKKVAEIKENRVNTVRTGRAIENASNVISNLYGKRFASGVIAQIQNELGVRVTEAFEIVYNLNKYYNEFNGNIENLKGKGNHHYHSKEILSELVAKIRECSSLPSQNTYRNDLKELNVGTTHDWRYTYANSEFDKKIEEGIEYHQALREVSEELNHTRRSMTLFYLERV